MNYQDKSKEELIEELESIHKLTNEKQAAGLAFINKEIAFHIQEKEKRAAEIIILYKELVYQNQEKEKRAAELIISNKNLNEALLKTQESESKHKFLFDNAPQGILYQNSNGDIRNANKAAERILGLTLDQMQGRTSMDPRWKAIHEDGSDFPGETHPAIITLQTGKAINNVIMGVFNPLQNDYTWINVNSIPRFRDGESKPFEVIATFEDITDKKKAKAEIEVLNNILEQRIKERTNQLELLNKELESFSYSVSHDLRTPLRSIDGFSSLIQKKYAGMLDEQGSDFFARIRKASQTMGQLIDDMLKLSHVTKSEMKMEKVNLSEIATSIINEIKELNPNHKAEFIIQSELEVLGDKSLLRIALQNLLDNAWKYSSKNESIRIEFGKVIYENSTVHFIRDNGVGFNMKFVDKLFGPFQRLHTVAEFEGNGIGLATVNRIIAKHGGSIWAEAEINRGTSFYFKI